MRRHVLWGYTLSGRNMVSVKRRRHTLYEKVCFCGRRHALSGEAHSLGKDMLSGRRHTLGEKEAHFWEEAC